MVLRHVAVTDNSVIDKGNDGRTPEQSSISVNQAVSSVTPMNDCLPPPVSLIPLALIHYANPIMLAHYICSMLCVPIMLILMPA